MICRFILDLRQVKQAGSSWISGNRSISLRFVGNAGESLQSGTMQDEWDHIPDDTPTEHARLDVHDLTRRNINEDVAIERDARIEVVSMLY